MFCDMIRMKPRSVACLDEAQAISILGRQGGAGVIKMIEYAHRDR
jgi:hypothetical protein